MKFFFIVILVSILVHAVEIDERKTDIYFGNGVWNDDTDAEIGRFALEIFIQLDLNRPNEKVKLAFNEHYGHRRDLVETFFSFPTSSLGMHT